MTALLAEGCGIAAFGGDEYIVSVTGFTLVSPMLHDEETKPPSPGRGAPQATEEQRRLDVRSQISDVRLRYVRPLPPDTAIRGVSEGSR